MTESGAVPCGAGAPRPRARAATALLRHLKIHPAIVVHPRRGSKIQLGERNLLPGLVVIEHPERSTSDRIIPHFFNMLVAEDQRRRGG